VNKDNKYQRAIEILQRELILQDGLGMAEKHRQKMVAAGVKTSPPIFQDMELAQHLKLAISLLKTEG
jgi:hypothetical protein